MTCYDLRKKKTRKNNPNYDWIGKTSRWTVFSLLVGTCAILAKDKIAETKVKDIRSELMEPGPESRARKSDLDVSTLYAFIYLFFNSKFTTIIIF